MARKSAVAVIDPETGLAVENTSTVSRNPGIMVAMPLEFKTIVDNDAKGQNTSSADLVRKLLANHYGYTLPIIKRGGGGGRRRIYANPEERKVAQTNKRNAQKQAVEMLMQLARDGQISLDPTLAATLGVKL